MHATAPVPLHFLSMNFSVFPYVSKLSWDFYLISGVRVKRAQIYMPRWDRSHSVTRLHQRKERAEGLLFILNVLLPAETNP
ncbi:hypothetical protein M9458_016239, partial [Cirrhinus mrigala]